MINPILGIDTWEGQLEIDESVLKANNISFMFIRLNNMSGGHHKDTGFDKQWEEAKNFYRAPYFVYNPWVSGSANFLWLQSNMPIDAKAVALDIEVAMSGYSSSSYAAEVKKFIDLVKPLWNFVIYTGEWFLQYLSSWPTDVDYWWAQYPYEFYPPDTMVLTWNELREQLIKYSVPYNYNKIPGKLRFWQFTGDRLILPGNIREIDINIFYGTPEELFSFFGGLSPTSDVITTPFDGGTRVSGKYNGWKFELIISDPTKVRYELLSTPALETVPSVIKRKGAVFGSNAGEWNNRDSSLPTYLKPEDYTVASGEVIMPRNEAVPSLMILEDNSILLDNKPTANVKQAFSGLRTLITNGTISSLLYGTEAKYTEGHARTIAGFNNHGHLMILLSEGIHPVVSIFDGLRLRDDAEIMKKYGCVKCADFGGGGDTGGILNGEDLIIPENIVNGQNVYRHLPMTFLIYANSIGDSMYEIKSDTHDMKLRDEHNTGGVSNIVIPKGTTMFADEIWTATTELWKIINGVNTKINSIGDKWGHVTKVGTVTYSKWVAIIHNGVTYCTVKDNTPVPADKKITDINIKLAEGSIVTTVYDDGSSDIKIA